MHNFAVIVDIGNTMVSIGFFVDHKYNSRIDIPSTKEDVIKSKNNFISFLKEHSFYKEDVTGGLICSVVPSLNDDVSNLIFEALNIKLPIMDKSYHYDIDIDVDDKDEVGGDLLADAIAAKHLYSYPAIIIDLGTVTKNIVLDEKGTFIGVSFFPGVKLCMDVMKEKTALLPEISLTKKPDKLIGNNTIEAMQSGVYYGTLSMVSKMASLVESKFSQPVSKILTGGNSYLFKDEIKDFIIDPELVLKGIYFIYINN